jgi:outer membrane protein
MKTLQKCLWYGLLLVSVAGGALGQDFKVGYINTQRITTESAPAKAAQGKLEQEFSKRQKELTELQPALKAAYEKFERDAPTLSESQRLARQKELSDRDREFKRKSGEFADDLNARRTEELQQVIDRANKAMKQVADSEKYDMVIQEVAYQNGKHDITDKVLKILNAAGK